jgi:exoribonuclease R
MIRGVLKTKDYAHFELWASEPIAAAPTITFTATSPEKTGRAFPGDTVAWDTEKECVVEVLSRAAGTTPIFLIGTLELAAKVRYGMTSRGAPIYRFSPYNASYPPFFVGCSQKDVTKNMLAKIQTDSWPADSTCPRGILVQTFGQAGDLAAEEEALLAHYSPVRWTTRLFREHSVVPPAGPAPAEPIPAFHVDPPGCRDIDDAISIEPDPADLGGSRLKIGIHIADVASWLGTNPWLGGLAEKIGGTLYKDGEPVRPMFPAELSEGLFSLLPGQERQAVSLFFSWSEEGGANLAQATWAQTRIRVSESYTYDSILSSPRAAQLRPLCSSLAERELTDSHEWIEQLMLLYNRTAAELLVSKAADVPAAILRRHVGPDQERLEALKGIGADVTHLAMRAGEYIEVGATDTTFHWGLQARAYCHASSPIRRWADCVNQMCLLSTLGLPLAPPLADVHTLNARSKEDKRYERDITFLRALIGPAAPKTIDAVVVDSKRIWVPAWNRLHKLEVAEPPGTRLTLKVFCDPSKRNWKGRLVLSILV